MTRHKLASLIAQKEGKKSQVRIGNIREVLKCLEECIAEEAMSTGDKDVTRTESLGIIVIGAKKKLPR